MGGRTRVDEGGRGWRNKGTKEQRNKGTREQGEEVEGGGGKRLLENALGSSAWSAFFTLFALFATKDELVEGLSVELGWFVAPNSTELCWSRCFCRLACSFELVIAHTSNALCTWAESTENAGPLLCIPLWNPSKGSARHFYFAVFFHVSGIEKQVEMDTSLSPGFRESRLIPEELKTKRKK